ncbi:MAG: DUF3500 domain-containing protein [Planctomycetota bacterium]|nr:DUF3500 domain-containing protein [Planctomycetota bacterium]
MKKLHQNIVRLIGLIAILAGLGMQETAPPAGEALVTAAIAFQDTLNPEQSKVAMLPYDDERRVDWHFIPKAERKGLMVRTMTGPQKKAASAVLRAGLSVLGHRKVRQIMALEGVLHDLEKENPGKFARDTLRYYYTLFGEPNAKGTWGLSIEGHHLSLNFVIKDSKVISSTPQVLCANPTIVKAEVGSVKAGTRVLKNEEVFAFELVNMLDAEQTKVAIVDEKAPREVRSAGAAQVPPGDPIGIAWGDLTMEQRKLLRKIVRVYAATMAPAIMEERMADIGEAKWAKVHFAWAGATKPGIGHYYRIQGPTFEIEFVNTQPDAAGNPASHIHCMWRDVRGDFAISK